VVVVLMIDTMRLNIIHYYYHKILWRNCGDMWKWTW